MSLETSPSLSRDKSHLSTPFTQTPVTFTKYVSPLPRHEGHLEQGGQFLKGFPRQGGCDRTTLKEESRGRDPISQVGERAETGAQALAPRLRVEEGEGS